MTTKTNSTFFIMIQRQEIDGAALYREIAQLTKNDSEREILLNIANDEYKHAVVFEKYIGRKPRPHRFRLFCYSLSTHILGYTFVIKLLERAEDFRGKSL